MRRVLRHYRRTGECIGRRWRQLGSNRSRSSSCAFGRSPDLVMIIRVELPQHLRTLAKVGREVQLEVKGHLTQRAVLDTLEAQYPMLRGTIRDHDTQHRRPF